MPEYLRENPLVLAALVTACATVTVMFVASVLSLQFLRLLRREASEFWAAKVGVGIGIARIWRISPASISRMSDDPVVARLCRRFARPLRIWRMMSVVFFIVTVALLTASGMKSR